MTCQDPRDIGSVGRPLPRYEVKIAPLDRGASAGQPVGGVLVRSPVGPRGYCNDAAETAATFGADGWIRTGDLGTLDSEGRLRIGGRVKELIILGGGHNVAPAPIESELLSACPLIAHACLIGEGRPHLAALIVLREPGTAIDPHARQAVAEAINTINAALGPRERVQRHLILTEPWLPGEELTATLKLRRARIADKYAPQVAALYA
jgi:long-subunit acyl-CoA synthetase (AMP-forming)